MQAPLDPLARQVQRFIETHRLLQPQQTVVIGVSGGPDSLALLSILKELAPHLEISLHAAHLNHMLRGTEAEADAQFVRAICAEWGIPCSIDSVDVRAEAKARRLATEEAARQVRYAFLGRVAEEVGAAAVAVGHTADDQVETVLMHLLRGSGLAGLRGMLPSTALANLHLLGARGGPAGVQLIRPLLRTFRTEVIAYCERQGLRPRQDSTNLDRTLFRNRLRHELIPYLETYNPRARSLILRTAELLAADYDFLCQAADEAWWTVVLAQDEERILFSLERFSALHLSLQRSLLRRAVFVLRPALRDVGWVHVERALALLVPRPRVGASATLRGGLALFVGYDRLAIAAQECDNPFGELGWPQLPAGTQLLELVLPGELAFNCWLLSATLLPVGELPADALHSPHPWIAYLAREACGQRLYLRPRKEGECIQPLGLQGHSKKLSELMINLKIPASCRARYPILANEEHILWLPGFHIDHRARITPATTTVVAVSLRRRCEADAP